MRPILYSGIHRADREDDVRIFGAKRLAEDLRDNKLEEGEKVTYLVIAIGINALIGTTDGLLKYWADPRNFAAGAVVLAVWSIGFFLCYEANQKGDGKNFIERLIVLGTALGITVMILFWTIWFMLVGLMIVAGAMPAWKEDEQFIAFAVLQTGMYILMFTKLRRAIRTASSGTATSVSIQTDSQPIGPVPVHPSHM